MRRSLPVLFFALALALRGDAQTPAPQSPAAPAPATLGAPAQTPGRGRGTGTPATGRGRGAETPAPTLDVAAIERGLGTPGQIIGDVYKISFPRSDLSVKVGDVALKPEFALAGWAAFKLLPTGNQAVVDGDLVLLESEVSPVLSAFQQHEFDVTAVHNSLPNASPTVMDVHFWAEGGAGELAASLKDVLSKTKTPMAAAAPAASAGELQVDKIQDAVGLKGAVTHGVLLLSQPRAESIQMLGVTLPPSMGMATTIAVQSAGGENIAATGDFVVIADEVSRVTRTLRQRDIDVTSLDNHTIHGSPELYDVHFWAEGDLTKIGAGLKAALAQIKRPPQPEPAARQP